MTNQGDDKAGQPITKPPHRYMLIAFLFFIAISGIAARLTLLGSEQIASDDGVWQLSMTITISGQADETLVYIYPPYETIHSRIIQQTLHHPGLRIKPYRKQADNKRGVAGLATIDGEITVTSEYLIHLSESPRFISGAKLLELTTKQRENYLKNENSLEIDSATVLNTLNKLNKNAANQNELVKEIFKYSNSLGSSQHKKNRAVSTVIASNKATPLERSQVMLSLSRAANIPARINAGFILKDIRTSSPVYWVELNLDNKWIPYDPLQGYIEKLPANFIPVRKNSNEIFTITNGNTKKIDYQIKQDALYNLKTMSIQKNMINILDLTRMPKESRDTLSLLLLLPLGALLTVACQSFIGMRNYGTFTPTLLALAVLYTDWLTTLVILSVVSSLSVIGRTTFPRSLSKGPRLSIIFTLVAISMAISISVMDYFSVNESGQILLLPIVILTSVIDRFYSTADSQGIKVATVRLIWTAVISILCLPIIQWETLGYQLLQFPEIHFTSVAMLLLIANYKGKKLFEIPPFNILALPKMHKTD